MEDSATRGHVGVDPRGLIVRYYSPSRPLAALLSNLTRHTAHHASYQCFGILYNMLLFLVLNRLLLKASGNGVVKPSWMACAVMEEDKRCTCNYTRNSLQQFGEDVGMVLRIALSKIRDLGRDAQLKQRCFQKASWRSVDITDTQEDIIYHYITITTAKYDISHRHSRVFKAILSK